MIDGATRLRRSPAVLFRYVGNEVLLAPQGTAELDILSGSAGAVWESLGEEQTVDELVNRLSCEFGATAATIRRDVQILIGDLMTRGVVEVVQEA